MRRIDLLSGILWCLLLVSSCTSGISVSPEVLFINPSLDSHHNLELDLDVEIDISDDKMIMEYKFWLESENGLAFFIDEKKLDKSHYKLMYSFDLSGHNPGDFTIHMDVKDYDGNKTSKYIDITAF